MYNNTYISLIIQNLEFALSCKHKDDINARHHFDNDDNNFGDMAILHRLVTSCYVNRTDLVITLMTFSNADINLTTGNGKTAFHLAVEVHYVGTAACSYKSLCGCI